MFWTIRRRAVQVSRHGLVTLDRNAIVGCVRRRGVCLRALFSKTDVASDPARTRRQAVDRMLGDLSYIFDLLHWSVLGTLKTGEGSYANRFLLCSEALVVTLVASYAIWRLFDRPINKWRAAWAGASRSSVRNVRSAMASVERLAYRECPWREGAV